MICDPCALPTSVNIPGPIGPDGADGADGADGTNAFTFVTAGAVMPAEGQNVTLDVIDSSWATIGQNVALQFAGEMEVVSKPNSISIVLKNLKDTPAKEYLGNVAPGTVIVNGAQISPSGKQGSAGIATAGSAPANVTYIVQVPDPSNTLTNEQAISTLPTGLIKNTTGSGILVPAIDGTDFLSPTTGLKPAAIGVTIQAKSANLDALSILAGVNNTFAYFTGPGAMLLATVTAFARTLLDDLTANAARLTLGVRYGLLGSVTGLDLNTAAPPATPVDLLQTITINSSRYIVDKVIVTDPSINITVATLGLFGSAGGGVPVICADQSLSALTATNKQKAMTISGAGSTDVLTAGTLIPRQGTPQGAAATVSMWVFGYDLS